MDNVNNMKDSTIDRGKMLIAAFPDRTSSEIAFKALEERGYTKDDIDIMMSEDTRKKYFSKGETELGNKALEGAGTGSTIGGIVGAAAGIIAAIGTSIVIPGLGIIIAGPIVAGLAGAGAGGITGGIIGALVGLGLKEERARIYESEIKGGKIVMSVYPKKEDDAKYFQSAWNSKGAEHVYYNE
jgi:hypothetical protein